jgi:hypothetical protein
MTTKKLFDTEAFVLELNQLDSIAKCVALSKKKGQPKLAIMACVARALLLDLHSKIATDPNTNKPYPQMNVYWGVKKGSPSFAALFRRHFELEGKANTKNFEKVMDALSIGKNQDESITGIGVFNLFPKETSKGWKMFIQLPEYVQEFSQNTKGVDSLLAELGIGV